MKRYDQLITISLIVFVTPHGSQLDVITPFSCVQEVAAYRAKGAKSDAGKKGGPGRPAGGKKAAPADDDDDDDDDDEDEEDDDEEDDDDDDDD